jgi:predicted transcriptional regulator
MQCDRATQERILKYLAERRAVNQGAEVSGQELAGELGVTMDAIRDCVRLLFEAGLIEAEIFPINLWVRLPDDVT